MEQINKVLKFDIDESILEERIIGHWMQPSSGCSYHTKVVFPKVPSVDEVRTRSS